MRRANLFEPLNFTSLSLKINDLVTLLTGDESPVDMILRRLPERDSKNSILLRFTVGVPIPAAALRRAGRPSAVFSFACALA